MEKCRTEKAVVQVSTDASSNLELSSQFSVSKLHLRDLGNISEALARRGKRYNNPKKQQEGLEMPGRRKSRKNNRSKERNRLRNAESPRTPSEPSTSAAQADKPVTPPKVPEAMDQKNEESLLDQASALSLSERDETREFPNFDETEKCVMSFFDTAIGSCDSILNDSTGEHSKKADEGGIEASDFSIIQAKLLSPGSSCETLDSMPRPVGTSSPISSSQHDRFIAVHPKKLWREYGNNSPCRVSGTFSPERLPAAAPRQNPVPRRLNPGIAKILESLNFHGISVQEDALSKRLPVALARLSLDEGEQSGDSPQSNDALDIPEKSPPVSSPESEETSPAKRGTKRQFEDSEVYYGAVLASPGKEGFKLARTDGLEFTSSPDAAPEKDDLLSSENGDDREIEAGKTDSPGADETPNQTEIEAEKTGTPNVEKSPNQSGLVKTDSKSTNETPKQPEIETEKNDCSGIESSNRPEIETDNTDSPNADEASNQPDTEPEKTDFPSTEETPKQPDTEPKKTDSPKQPEIEAEKTDTPGAEESGIEAEKNDCSDAESSNQAGIGPENHDSPSNDESPKQPATETEKTDTPGAEESPKQPEIETEKNGSPNADEAPNQAGIGPGNNDLPSNDESPKQPEIETDSPGTEETPNQQGTGTGNRGNTIPPKAARKDEDTEKNLIQVILGLLFFVFISIPILFVLKLIMDLFRCVKRSIFRKKK